jgi:hypothetical protein
MPYSRPLTLIFKEKRQSMETYYKPEDLSKFGEIGKDAPELAKKFFDYYGAVLADGAQTERGKSLIALAVAAMRGWASLVHGIQMRNVAEKLSI